MASPAYFRRASGNTYTAVHKLESRFRAPSRARCFVLDRVYGACHLGFRVRENIPGFETKTACHENARSTAVSQRFFFGSNPLTLVGNPIAWCLRTPCLDATYPNAKKRPIADTCTKKNPLEQTLKVAASRSTLEVGSTYRITKCSSHARSCSWSAHRQI